MGKTSKLEKLLDRQDISEEDKLELIELLMQTSNDRFRRLTDNLPAAVFEADKDMKIQYGNKKALEIFMYTIKDINHGLNGLDTLIPEDRPKALENITKRAKGIDIGRVEYTGLRKDGSTFPMLFYSDPITENNKIVGLRGFIIDITNLKHAEDALIKNERLKTIGEVATGIAHDFNNELQGILGNIELALMDTTEPYLVNLLKSALDKGIRASSRIKKLQNFAKNKNNPDLQKYNNLNINEIIMETIDQTKYLWYNQSQKNGILINVTSKLEKDLGTYGNKMDLESVLHNMIRNSVQAMPQGGTINICSKKKTDKVYITIADTGNGMNELTKKRIFDPFFSTKGYEQGTGLGMSSAYCIIQNHNGTIKIKDSKINKGTTFEITLPYQNIENILKENDDNKCYLLTGNILIVDDLDDVRYVIEKMLTRQGYKVDSAASGNEALNLSSENKYDLMITDINMPEMNGWQLAKEVKEKYQDTKIAILSGHDTIEVSEEKKQNSGVSYLLSKPILLKDLKKITMDVFKYQKQKK